MEYRLGVDLGTTWTAAAVVDGGPPSMLGLGNRSLQVPSVVFLQPDGRLLVGEAAERRGLEDPTRLVREFKRRLGDSVPILVAGTPFSPQALLVRLLRWVVDRAGERMGAQPTELTVTHPANWGPFKQDLLRQVVRMADLDDLRAVRTCTEPQAAAMQYASRSRVADGAPILVYDLGGGTFDVCVLTCDHGEFRTLGEPEGIEHLGGIDFDEAVFRDVLGRLGDPVRSLDATDPEVAAALYRLRRDCVEAKEALSSDDDAVVRVQLPGVTTTVRVTRAELEALIGPSIDDTFGAVRRAMRSAGVTKGDLGALVLVGGSSRIPLIARELAREFGGRIAVDTHPKHDVALGAARVTGTDGEPPAHVASPPVAARPVTIAAREQPETLVPQPDPGPAPAPVALEAAAEAAPETVTAPDAQPAPAPSDDRPRSPSRPRRASLLVGLAAVAVLAAGGLTWGLTRHHGAGASSTGTSTPSTSTPSTSTPSVTAARAAVLPQSAKPLPLDTVVWPRRVRANMDIWSVAVDGRHPQRLTSDAAEDTRPVLTPDRRSIIYTRFDAADAPHLRVMGADGSGDRPLFTSVPASTLELIRPGISPDEADIATVVISKSASDPASLVVIHLASGSVRPIASAAKIGDPTWTRDGTQVVYWASTPTQLDGGTLMIVRADGKTAPRVVVPGAPGQDADPAWSPSGAQLAFRRRGHDGFDIWVVNADGTGLRRLTTAKGDDQDPTWSPDGTQIAFKSSRQGQSDLWVMRADGSDPRLVLPNPGADDAPSWTGR